MGAQDVDRLIRARTFFKHGGVGSLRDFHRLCPLPRGMAFISGEGWRSKSGGLLSLICDVEESIGVGGACSGMPFRRLCRLGDPCGLLEIRRD